MLLNAVLAAFVVLSKGFRLLHLRLDPIFGLFPYLYDGRENL